VDRSPRLGTAHRRAARPPHPPCPHPGDERGQLPSQAEPAQTRYRQLLTQAQTSSPPGVWRLPLRSRRHTPKKIHCISWTTFTPPQWLPFTPPLTPKILLISDIACARASISGLPVITLALACPFSNTREIHLLACYKAAYRTRRQLMHNRPCALRGLRLRVSG